MTCEHCQERPDNEWLLFEELMNKYTSGELTDHQLYGLSMGLLTVKA